MVEGPIGIGAEIFSSCASCHGAEGGGGVGYAFAGGEVLKTFPHIEDQIRYVYYGTEGYNAADVEIYGNPDREGGAHVTGNLGVMPAFGGQLTQYEILAVVCHERYTLGGADPTSEEYAAEYETWCSEESPVFAELEAGTYDYTSPDAPDDGRGRDHADRPRTRPGLASVGRLTGDALDTDVLVVGGGPAGASVATWLARSGHHVTLVEKRPVAAPQGLR